MKVLATTDGSDCSRLALSRLGTLIPVPDADVLLMAVYPGPTTGALGLAGPPYIDYTAYADQVRAEAERFAQEGQALLTPQGFRVRILVQEGDPASAILDVAVQEGSDLIVVGSHGRTGLARFFLGSVSSRVVAHAACSVLVVKGATEPSS